VGRAELLERIRIVVLPVLERLGLELVELSLVSHGRRILRVFIDKEAGVTLDDCAMASKALSCELDAYEFFPGRYYLEVSSPGAERRLRTREDFARFTGRKSRIRFREPGGKIKELVGTIESFKDEVLVVQPEGETGVSVSFANILGANLSI
jgi:ribosome maturation factor RimP